MTNIDSFTPAAVAAIRALYDDGVSTAEICARFAIGRKRFYALRKAHGWPPRGTHARHQPQRQSMTPRFDPHMMIARLEAAASQLISEIEADRKNPEATNMRANIRLLASIRQALVELEGIKDLYARDAPTRH